MSYYTAGMGDFESGLGATSTRDKRASAGLARARAMYAPAVAAANAAKKRKAAALAAGLARTRALYAKAAPKKRKSVNVAVRRPAAARAKPLRRPLPRTMTAARPSGGGGLYTSDSYAGGWGGDAGGGVSDGELDRYEDAIGANAMAPAAQSTMSPAYSGGSSTPDDFDVNDDLLTRDAAEDQDAAGAPDAVAPAPKKSSSLLVFGGLAAAAGYYFFMR